MRAWTLVRDSIRGQPYVFATEGPLPERGEDVPVLEREPMLDLLERIRERNDHTDRAEVDALLRKHGRLGG